MRALVSIGLAAAIISAACDSTPNYFEDPDLQRIYIRMMEAMAPDRGWERVRYIAFDRVADRPGDEPLRRAHRWDVWDGQYRVEGPVGDEQMVAVFDVDDPEGY